jgi:hypothetical protein
MSAEVDLALLQTIKDLLDNAPCTCPNPEPHDWPHDMSNSNCYKTLVEKALGKNDIIWNKLISQIENISQA